MLMPDSVTEPTLPARSVARPVADSLAPSDDRMTGAFRLPGATPDTASAAANVTTTGVLFQPFALAAGDRVAVTTGGVLSMLRVTLAVCVFPALSAAVPE